MTALHVEKQAEKECGKPRRQQVDRERIVRMWTEHGGFWTQQIIAEACKCSIQTVRNVLIREGFQKTWSVDGITWRTIEREKVCQG